MRQQQDETPPRLVVVVFLQKRECARLQCLTPLQPLQYIQRSMFDTFTTFAICSTGVLHTRRHRLRVHQGGRAFEHANEVRTVMLANVSSIEATSSCHHGFRLYIKGAFEVQMLTA